MYRSSSGGKRSARRRVVTGLFAILVILAADPQTAQAVFLYGGPPGTSTPRLVYARINPTFPTPEKPGQSAGAQLALPVATPKPQGAPRPLAHPPAPPKSLAHDPSSAAPPAQPVPPREGWTSSTHWAPANTSGNQLTETLYSTPHYRHAGDKWQTIDDTISASSNPAWPLAAGGALRPIRFGTSAASLVEFDVDGGPLTFSAPGLTVGKPALTAGSVVYASVAKDTELRYSVGEGGLKEEIVLGSAAAPQQFTFHVSDPRAQLGKATTNADESVRFDLNIDGEVGVGLGAPFAYESGSEAREPGSAHQKIVPAGDGYDVTLSVDPKWVSGKTFPIVLDPTLTLTTSNALISTIGWDGYYVPPVGPGSGNNVLTTNGDLAAGVAQLYQPARTFMSLNVSSIPSGSQVTSAVLQLVQYQCFGVPAPCQSYTVQAHPMTAAWTAASTWTQLAAASGSTSAASASTPNGVGPSAPATETWDLSSLVSGWVAGSANYGTELQLASEAGQAGGPVWCFESSACPSTLARPQLTITYSPPPGAPQTVRAYPYTDSSNNDFAALTWSPPMDNGGPTVTGYSAYPYEFQPSSNTWTYFTKYGGAQSCSVPCPSSLTFQFDPDNSFVFQMVAVNSVGAGAIGQSNAIGPPLSVSQTISTTGPLFRGEVVQLTATVTNRSSTLSAGPLVEMQVDDGGRFLPAPFSFTFDGNPCGPPLCTLSNNLLTVSGSVMLNPGASHTLGYSATLLGADRGCANATAKVTAWSDTYVGATTEYFGQAIGAAPVCNSGLGLESWWTYVDRTIGPLSSAAVNVANGNLVLQQQDDVTVKGHGEVDYELTRTYNSEDLGVTPLSNGLGPGWSLSIGGVGDPSSAEAAPVGLYIPSGESASAPFPVTYLDRDATRHVFTLLQQLATPLDVTAALAGIRGTLTPKRLTLDSGFSHVCVDSLYSPPPGVHMGLWRYTETSGACATGAGSILGYAAERPDRIRYEFNALGQLVDLADEAGVELAYAYDPTTHHPLNVFEPLACSDTSGATCRGYHFSYPSSTQINVADPAAETTTYNLDSAGRLASVIYPDSATAAFTYTYGTCGGSTIQLCSVKDPRGNTSSFAYATAPLGPARATQITDRRGTVTSITYSDSPDFVTADMSDNRQTFLAIDGYGRVGEVREGATSNYYLHQTLYNWDGTGTGTTQCRQPDSAMDMDLCEVVRRSLTPATPDSDTKFVYNPEGHQLVAQRVMGPSSSFYVTSGYHAQYAEANAVSPVTFDDTVAGYGTVTSAGAVRADTNTIFYLSDLKQSLTPNGNASGDTYAPYMTTYVRDNAGNASPNARPAGTVCPTTTGNSGLACEVDEPSFDGGVHANTITRYTYQQQDGQIATIQTPKAIAESLAGVYTLTYWPDTATDVSGLVSAGGWLEGVTDPLGNSIAYKYDPLGHVTYTWDQDQVGTQSFGAFFSVPIPANSVHTVYSSTAIPWRYQTSSADPLGDTTQYAPDRNGNDLSVRPPRGVLAGNSTFDITQSFDANDNLASVVTPVEGAGHPRSYTYNAFNTVSSTTDPNGNVVVYLHDNVDRLIASQFTRDAWPADTTQVPASCRQSTTSDVPIPAGRILCASSIAYDGADNQTSTTDPTGLTTNNSWDAAGRLTQSSHNRTNGYSVVTAFNYDADGNVTDACPPDEMDGNNPGAAGACTATGIYSTHERYDPLDRVVSRTTYLAVPEQQPQLQVSTQGYDADGNQTSLTQPTSVPATMWQYNVVDQKVGMTVPRSAGVSYTTTYQYDPAGLLLAESDPGDQTGCAGGHGGGCIINLPLITAYSYDVAHRLLDVVRGSDSTSAAAMYPLSADGGSNQRSRRAYDADGHVIKTWGGQAFTGTFTATTEDDRFTVQTAYDNDGRPVSTEVPRYDNTPNSGYAIPTYNGSAIDGGQQTTDCPAGVTGYGANVGVCTTQAQYNHDGNLTKVILPTTSAGTGYIVYGYSDDGLVKSVTQPDPQRPGSTAATTYLYDAGGRQVKMTLPDPSTGATGGGQQTVTSYYSDGLLAGHVYQAGSTGTTHSDQYQYDDSGNPVSFSDGVHLEERSYLSNGLVAQSIDGGNTGSGADLVTAYSYDLAGNPCT